MAGQGKRERDRSRGRDAPALAPVLERNIAALCRRRAREAQSASRQARVSDAITRFVGSMRFAYLHLALYGGWILLSLTWGRGSFDRSLMMLATVASVEAIFLSTFVLITQNRMAESEQKRTELDLQISLLSEHEITKLTGLVAEIARKVGVDTDGEIEEVTRDVAPDAVLDRLEAGGAQRRERV